METSTPFEQPDATPACRRRKVNTDSIRRRRWTLGNRFDLQSGDPHELEEGPFLQLVARDDEEGGG